MEQYKYGPCLLIIVATIATTVFGMTLPQNATDFVTATEALDVSPHVSGTLQLTDLKEVELESIQTGDCNTRQILKGVLRLKEGVSEEPTAGESQDSLLVIPKATPAEKPDLRKTTLMLEVENAVLKKLAATKAPNLRFFQRIKNKFTTVAPVAMQAMEAQPK